MLYAGYPAFVSVLEVFNNELHEANTRTTSPQPHLGYLWSDWDVAPLKLSDLEVGKSSLSADLTQISRVAHSLQVAFHFHPFTSEYSCYFCCDHSFNLHFCQKCHLASTMKPSKMLHIWMRPNPREVREKVTVTEDFDVVVRWGNEVDDFMETYRWSGKELIVKCQRWIHHWRKEWNARNYFIRNADQWTLNVHIATVHESVARSTEILCWIYQDERICK